MNLTPEEKYHNDRWFVLQQIREKELYTPKSEQKLHTGFGNYRVWKSGIQYRLNITPYSKFEECPPSKQINILRQLAEEGAIKIVDEENRSGYGAYYLFILQVQRPKFDELYRQYEQSGQKTGTFNEEVLKTEQLLDKLENDINERLKKQEQFEIKVKDRQIWINDYLLSKPFAVGSNLEFFEYIRSKPPNTLITRNKMPNIGDGIGYGYTKEAIKKKGFIKILNELGFKDQILKAFFYKRSKNTLIYRGDKITKEDLDKAGVKFSLFIKELELAHAKNSPE